LEERWKLPVRRDKTMGQVVTVSRGTSKDLDRYGAFAAKATELIEEKAPGTETFEFYVEEETSRVVWLAEFTDGAAILQHYQVLAESGILEEVAGLVDWDFDVVLGDPGPEATAALKQAGTDEFYGLSSKAR
jgi:hypothetical protein